MNSKEGLHGEMRAAVHRSESVLSDMESDILARVQVQTSKEQNTSILLSLLLAAVSTGAIVVFARSIILPINELSAVMAQASATRDLSLRAQNHGRDEISTMARVFNTMVGEFQNVIQQVLVSSGRVSSAADDLSVITEQPSHGILRQQAESEQVATSMQEMTSTVQEVARNADTAANASQTAVAEEIKRNVFNITQVADETAEAANHTTNTSGNLSDLATALEQHIGQFRL